MREDRITWSMIADKEIAIVDDHHVALAAWAKWTRGAVATRLITIDHHCDTIDAFQRAAYDETRDRIDEDRRRMLVEAMDPDDEESVWTAIEHLRHDEHIAAAVRSGIIDAAFIVAEQNQRSVKSREHLAWKAGYAALDHVDQFHYIKQVPQPVPPMTYDMPASRMVAIDPPAYLTPTGLVDPWPDRVVEADHLDDRIGIFDAISRGAGEPSLLDHPYILDIDLDAFNSRKALEPDDPSAFLRLIQGARGITIAREEHCFKLCWRVGEAPDVALVQDGVLAMIRRALGTD